MTRGACLTENTLADFIHGRAAPATFAVVERHVGDCASCRDVVAQYAMAFFSSRSHSTHSSSDVSAHSSGAAPAADPGEPFAEIPQGRYDVGREIARGGMGRVLTAWDRRHERPVAIKMLLGEGSLSRARFAREAKITARLQHPAIVPLYEAGRWPSGESFFAMKLVEGESFSRVIGQTRTLEQKMALLPKLVAVIDALACAHAQRIVHRDLKPSNVLVGAFGETVVIDWGLAKELDAEDSDDERAPSEAEGAALTVAGRAVGTPSYMPPEQARGDAVDMRADVYALGAMLYHLFAGRPPYEGRSSRETLDAVIAGPPEPLARRAPGLPADLVALVEKAMARDPAARYPTAKDMAADLGRFIAGQLVSAHAYSLVSLARRWVARNQAVVATAAVFLVGLAATAWVAARDVVRERDRADASRQAAIVERDAAEKLVGFVIGDLKSRLEPLGKLALLEGVGDRVEAYYAAVTAPGEWVDIATLERRAAALETLAAVELYRQRPEPLQRMYGAAIALRERAASEDRSAVDDLYAVSGDHSVLAEAVGDTGAAEEFLREIDLARDAIERIETRTGRTSRSLLRSAYVEGIRARWLSGRGDPRPTLEALDAERSFLDAVPDGERSAYWYDENAWVEMMVGTEETKQARFDEANTALQAAVAAYAQRLAGAPGDARKRYDLASAQHMLAFLYSMRSRFDEARAMLEVARSTLRALAAGDPDNVGAQLAVFDTTRMLCEVALASHHAAYPECEDASALAEKLANGGSDDGFRYERAECQVDLGRAKLDRGEVGQARALFAEAVRAAEAESARPSSERRWRVAFGNAEQWSAAGALRAGAFVEARDSYRRAIGKMSPMMAEAPDDRQLGDALVEAFEVGGDVERAPGGDRATAARLYRQAVQMRERRLAADPDALEEVAALAAAERKLASATDDVQERSSALQRASALSARVSSRAASLR
jgi:tetratricopeptide (TPR) repeat protein